MLTSDEDIDVVTSSHGHTISDSGRDPAGPFFVLRLRYEDKIHKTFKYNLIKIRSPHLLHIFYQ
jgi:hypothetical protein